MTGYIIKMPAEKFFGFIKAGNGKEYFFHRADYNGHWDDLRREFDFVKDKINVEFDVVDSSKGPRAGNVRRIEI